MDQQNDLFKDTARSRLRCAALHFMQLEIFSELAAIRHYFRLNSYDMEQATMHLSFSDNDEVWLMEQLSRQFGKSYKIADRVEHETTHVTQLHLTNLFQ